MFITFSPLSFSLILSLTIFLGIILIVEGHISQCHLTSQNVVQKGSLQCVKFMSYILIAIGHFRVSTSGQTDLLFGWLNARPAYPKNFIMHTLLWLIAVLIPIIAYVERSVLLLFPKNAESGISSTDMTTLMGNSYKM